jgi:hypothetical protein
MRRAIEGARVRLVFDQDGTGRVFSARMRTQTSPVNPALKPPQGAFSAQAEVGRDARLQAGRLKYIRSVYFLANIDHVLRRKLSNSAS